METKETEITKSTEFEVAGHKVWVEFINNERTYRWRMRADDNSTTRWVGHYGGILLMQTTFGLIGLMGEYWNTSREECLLDDGLVIRGYSFYKGAVNVPFLMGFGVEVV